MNVGFIYLIGYSLLITLMVFIYHKNKLKGSLLKFIFLIILMIVEAVLYFQGLSRVLFYGFYLLLAVYLIVLGIGGRK